jgi:acyl carrier protein
MMAVKQSIRNFLTKNAFYSGLVPENLEDSFPLIDSGVLDSLGVFKLVGFLETTFQIQIDVDDLSKGSFGSLTEIERFVTQKMSEGASNPAS